MEAHKGHQQAGLHEFTRRLLAQHGPRIQKVDAHDADDPEGGDHLWLVVVDHDLTEGELLSVKPLSEGNWSVCHDLAHKFGGWPTVWDVWGTADFVQEAVTAYLRQEEAHRESAT